jgi:HPr kinase/phosphorylase
MSAAVSARSLFETYAAKLDLRWVAGQSGEGRLIRPSDNQPAGMSLIGHLNFIHPNLVQVLGVSELRYLRGLGKNSRQDALQRLFSDRAALVLVTDGLRVPSDLREQADRSGIPLFSTGLPSNSVIENLQYHLAHLLAEKQILHGVFMEVMGIGVLITGEASVGKSELALELITRGHRLIADDAPEFAHIAPDVLSGTCPEPLQSFLEVRGLGVLNIRAMFGDSAVKVNKYLRLIVHLKPMTEGELAGIDRLQGSRRTRQVLGVDVAEITLPVAPGRNLAVLVEAAVRNHILKLKGYDAAADFMKRQQRYIASDS